MIFKNLFYIAYFIATIVWAGFIIYNFPLYSLIMMIFNVVGAYLIFKESKNISATLDKTKF